MPKPFPKEFREDVVRVARTSDAPVAQVAKDFGISELCLHRWLALDDVEPGKRPGVTASESAELRELRKRNRLLEQERGAAPCGGVSVAGEPAGQLREMMYPLVRELADVGIPVAVTCRVLNRKAAVLPVARAAGDRRRVVTAHRANALFDAHRDDPEFGYRFLADEARDDGQPMADRTAWRIHSANGWWSVLGKPRGRNGKKKRTPGTPAFDDLVHREFTALAPNMLWLVDITSTGPARASSARSRTASATGSSATPSPPA